MDLPSLQRSLEHNSDLKVYSPVPLDLGAHSGRVTLVSAGDEFVVGDIPVDVVGEFQAEASIHDEPITNVGYVLAGRFLHPGDARQELQGIPTVMVALAAPWQNTPQLEQHLERTQPVLIIGYHDATQSELGRDFGAKTLARIAQRYGGNALALAPGESVELTMTKPTES